MRLRRAALPLATAFAWMSPADAQEMPLSDTEDADLSEVSVGSGRIHPVFQLDVRNGDFTRGEYDDDAANLDRVPVHAQLSLGWELHRDSAGEADSWLELRTSNGFHSPIAAESGSPRAWYESNNLVGLVLAPMADLHAAITYTIKSSPNGVSSTTHELSGALAYGGKGGLGVLKPSFVVTWRPKGGHGLFTQIGIEPGLPLGAGEDAPKISLPAKFGVGWRDFYDPGTGTGTYGSAGIALSQPFRVGGLHWQARAEGSALIRDRDVRLIGSDDAEHGRVVPFGMLTLTAAY